MAKKKEAKSIEIANVESALSTTEAFIEKYQKHILIVIGVVVILVLGILSYKNFYQKPRELNAQNEMAKAQIAFANDMYKVALEGDGRESIGFKGIVSDFGGTTSGKLAVAYVGICDYKLGKFQEAIDNLKDYSGNDAYFSTMVTGLIGDSYIELNQTDKAIEYFKKAIDKDNKVLSPYFLQKLGMVYEALNQKDNALKTYKEIKEKYPVSAEGKEIDKYITQLEK